MNNDHKHHELVILSFKVFLWEVVTLIKSPVFILLTILGNSAIGLFSYLFYLLENPINPKVQTYFDALWWGFSTATTTGFGDVIPATMGGRILSMLLMLTGLAFFGMFTALFAETILANKRKH